MSTLIVHELITTLTQEFKVPSLVQAMEVKHVRPYLYKNGSPTGTIQMEIGDGNIKMAQSATLDVSTISAVAYAHGPYKFDLSAHLRPGDTYQLTMRAVTYVFDANNFVGWCNGFDLGFNDPTYEPNGYTAAPLHFELWTQEDRDRRRV